MSQDRDSFTQEYVLEDNSSPNSFYKKLITVDKIEHKIYMWLLPFYTKSTCLSGRLPIHTGYPKYISMKNEEKATKDAIGKAVSKKLVKVGEIMEDLSIKDVYQATFIFKIFTNTNEYTFTVKEKDKIEEVTMSATAMSRETRAGDVYRKTKELGEYAFSDEGWSMAKDDILKYEVLDSIKDKWKKTDL